MKYLAIDYGQKRTGIAVSDTGGSMAFPRKTILMRTRAAFFEELLALIEAEATDAIVIGFPSTRRRGKPHDPAGPQLSKSLARRTTLPLFWMEEASAATKPKGTSGTPDVPRLKAGPYSTSRPPCASCNLSSINRKPNGKPYERIPRRNQNTPADPAPRAQKKQAYLPAYRIHGINRLLRINNIPMRHPPKQRTGQPTDKKPGEASPLDGEEPETPLPASAPETPNPKRLWPRFLLGSCCWSCWLAAEPVGWPMTS